MGGRGSKYQIVSRLPNYKKAILSRPKFKNYLLNPSKDPEKAAFFKSLGYTMKNYKRLEADIRKKLSHNKALEYDKDKYGNRTFTVNMALGISKRRIVSTGWIIRPGDSAPRLVTAYPNKRAYFKRTNDNESN